MFTHRYTNPLFNSYAGKQNFPKSKPTVALVLKCKHFNNSFYFAYSYILVTAKCKFK